MPAHPRPRLLAIALLLALPAFAAEPPQQAQHDRQPKDLAAVEVRATPLADTAESLATPVDVLAGSKLDEAKAGTLGETVARLPGVQSSNFGPGVGRPIIRGLDGARVQVLSDGLGSGDVSTVSVDHAVSIEPFLANQIEVLKGPATLLYGSGAIGGAVNVVDGRITESIADVPFSGRAELRRGSVNDEATGMVRIDGNAGAFAFHFDALHRETGDYAIPGYPESAALMAEHGETPDPDEAGILRNSAVRTDSAALGLSWIGARGFIGGSYSLFNTAYGIPGGHAHGGEEDEHEGEHAEEEAEEHGDGDVSILMDQRRSELRAGIDNVGPFQSMRLKLADTDYTHTEFEGEAVGTVFHNRSREARAELVHVPVAGWKGAFGVQASKRDFDAIGDEAFVPASRSYDTGLFWIGKRSFDTARGALQVDLGVRHDDNRIDVDNVVTAAPDRHVHTTSASAGFGWKASEALHLSLGLDRAQRAPGAEELYSNGLHVATGSFEFGDATLGVETARRIELGLHLHHGPVEVQLSAWQARYDDFVYLAGTDAQVDGAPLRVWRQDDARFHGLEAKLDWDIAGTDAGVWSLNVFGDIVRGRLVADAGSTALQVFEVEHGDHVDAVTARVANGGNLPRIVPARVGATLRWERERWRASLGAVRYAKQDDVAAYETATPGYTLVDAHVAWHIDTKSGREIELFVDANNLSDQEARPHTSFLKDVVPLPGRNVVLGVRAFF